LSFNTSLCIILQCDKQSNHVMLNANGPTILFLISRYSSYQVILYSKVIPAGGYFTSMISHYDWLGFHPIRDLWATTNLTMLSFFDHTYSLSWNITFFFIYDFVLCNTLIVVNFINFFAFLQYPIKTNNLLRLLCVRSRDNLALKGVLSTKTGRK
jgi:hypothetical protein